MQFESGDSRSPLQPLSPNVERQREETYNKKITTAKQLCKSGKIQEGLEAYIAAYKINKNQKLKERIKKIQKYLEELSEEEGDDVVHVGNGFSLYKELYDKLYAHQREGVLWMWELYRKKKGGILGDDMGLGKTIQVISFLSGMFDADKVHAVLIILPVAVIVNWEREFETWAPGIRIASYHGGGKSERARNLAKVHRRGGVVITSYGMLTNNADSLASKDGRDYIWDYVILDEGHKIKNPATKCSKGVHSIPARNRIILTGTPIMNNLKEMWALFDYCHQGSLLGNMRTFAMEFEGPINRARQKDATPGEQRLGAEISKTLSKLIAPYFLRRSKAVLSKKQQDDKARGIVPSNDKNEAPAMPSLTRKNDLVVWVYLSEVQQRIYEEFSNSDEIKELLNSSRSPLVALTVLKKMCDHPRLMTTRQCRKLGLYVEEDDTDDEEAEFGRKKEEVCAANRIDLVSDELLIEESGKMVFLMELLDNLKATGHRCLVFSQSKKMLDIIQRVITNRGHRVSRLDGSISKIHEREAIIDKFTENKQYSVFLLTTGVGGVGLTLTAADRVVIFDPSWNPATDAQAVDRAFRIGQDKNVVIYRLITCGSVEEKIYRRQIFKDSIMRQTTGDAKNPYRYFSRQELHELFALDNPRVSSTQQQLEQLHAHHRKTDTTLDEHIAFLHSLAMYGISDHDLMFSQEAQDEQHADEELMGADYIQGRVTKAAQLISLESEENVQQVAQTGGYKSHEVFKVRGEGVPRALPAFHPGGIGGGGDAGAADTNYEQDENQLRRELDGVHISQPDRESEDERNDVQYIKDSDESEGEGNGPPPRSPTPPPSTKPVIPTDGKLQDTQKAVDSPQVICLDTPMQTEDSSIKASVSANDTPHRPKHDRHSLGPSEQFPAKVKDDHNLLLNNDNDDDEDMEDIDEYESQVISALLKHSKPRQSSGVGSIGTPSKGEELVERGSYCATPQEKCMREDKQSGSVTPKTPKTPAVVDQSNRSSTSPDSRKRLSSHFTPEVNKKKRRSVCVPRTPLPHTPLGMNVRPKSPEVVHEELIFSPSGADPLVGIRTPSKAVQRKTADDDDYEDSPIVRASRQPKRNLLASSDEEEEEVDNEEEEGEQEEEDDANDDNEVSKEQSEADTDEEPSGDEEATDDSNVGAKSMHNFIVDDDDEEEEDESFNNDESVNNDASGNSSVLEKSTGREKHPVEKSSELHEKEESAEESEEEMTDEQSGSEEDSEEISDSDSDDGLTAEQVEEYNSYMSKSKSYKSQSLIHEALKCAVKALKIYDKDETAQLYVEKLRRKLSPM